MVSLYRIAPTLQLGQDIREINNDFCEAITIAPGAEDITIQKTRNIAFIAADERRSYLKFGVNIDQNGTLWSLDLAKKNSRPVQIQTDLESAFHPHGVSLFTDKTGKDFLYVINHVTTKQHEINVFELVSNDQAKLVTTHTFDELVSPNDLHVIDHHTFFVTNDHGSPRNTFGEKVEDLLRLPSSNLVFFNGTTAQVVIEDLYMANGVILNADNSLLYVSESTGSRVREFEQDSNGTWGATNTFTLDFMPDNLEWDDAGNLLTAGHPKALDFMMHTFDAEQLAPSVAVRINVKNGEVETLYEDIGDDLSGSSVAAMHDNQLLIGSVFEPKFLRCNLVASN